MLCHNFCRWRDFVCQRPFYARFKSLWGDCHFQRNSFGQSDDSCCQTRHQREPNKVRNILYFCKATTVLQKSKVTKNCLQILAAGQRISRRGLSECASPSKTIIISAWVNIFHAPLITFYSRIWNTLTQSISQRNREFLESRQRKKSRNWVTAKVIEFLEPRGFTTRAVVVAKIKSSHLLENTYAPNFFFHFCGFVTCGLKDF